MKNQAILAVAIITYNEEENIGDCLESIMDLVDEIVVEKPSNLPPHNQ